MRKTVSIILIGFLVILLSSLAFADLQDFSGRWVNVDSNTRGVTGLNINTDRGQITVQAWGQAHPSDIDWGTVPGYAYTGSVQDNPFQGAQAITALFLTNFNETWLVIRSQGAELQVEAFTRFTDNSRRSNYLAQYRFRRDLRGPGHWLGPGPLGPGPGPLGPQEPQGPQGNQGHQWFQLDTPRQISPAPGSVFNRFPRRTTLRWSPVNGAQSYCVEIDYYDFNWLTEQGKTYLVITNLTATSYTFNFVGAQPGRWRVWAVGPGGQESPKSNWWEFKYTR